MYKLFIDTNIQGKRYTVKKGSRVPVSCRDVTNQTPPELEFLKSLWGLGTEEE
jgi:hypothetical protein